MKEHPDGRSNESRLLFILLITVINNNKKKHVEMKKADIGINKYTFSANIKLIDVT